MAEKKPFWPQWFRRKRTSTEDQEPAEVQELAAQQEPAEVQELVDEPESPQAVGAPEAEQVSRVFRSLTSLICARNVTSSMIGVGRLYDTFREPVANQMRSPVPISLPSARYAAAIAVQMQWQSIRVAMMPPFRTWVGPAMWYSCGFQLQTDSSPDQ